MSETKGNNSLYFIVILMKIVKNTSYSQLLRLNRKQTNSSGRDIDLLADVCKVESLQKYCVNISICFSFTLNTIINIIQLSKKYP